MEPQAKIMELITEAAEKGCSLSSGIMLDCLPECGGIYAELMPGYTDSLYYNKGAIRILPVLLQCKGKNQLECIEQLSQICNYLQSMYHYPQADGFIWMDAATTTEPNKVGRQEDGQFIYAAIIDVKIYF